MERELAWMILVMVGVFVILLCSKVVRTMMREAVMHPKERCKIEVTKNGITVTPQQTTIGGDKHGRS